MDNKKVSVIIPVYNVEAYLPDCLNSIINQTYKYLEIILIDDGSTDNSGILCDQYALKHPEITVIHQCNRGVSSARNKGLGMASGDFISFIDPDDCLDPNTYATMILLMEETKADISFFEFFWFNDKIPNTQFEPLSTYDMLFFEGEERISIPLRYSGSSCNCIYTSTLIKNQKFSENYKLAEDTLFLVEALIKSHATIFINKKFYFRRFRQNSASRTQYNQEWIKIIEIADRIGALLMQNNLSYANIANFLWYTKVYELINKLKFDYNQYMQDVFYIQAHIKHHYADIKKNPYIPFKSKLLFTLYYFSPILFYWIMKLYSISKNMFLNRYEEN